MLGFLAGSLSQVGGIGVAGTAALHAPVEIGAAILHPAFSLLGRSAPGFRTPFTHFPLQSAEGTELKTLWGISTILCDEGPAGHGESHHWHRPVRGSGHLQTVSAGGWTDQRMSACPALDELLGGRYLCDLRRII